MFWSETTAGEKTSLNARQICSTSGNCPAARSFCAAITTCSGMPKRLLSSTRSSLRTSFLQDNYAAYQDYAIVGTKGYTFEGPFYLDHRRRIIDWDEKEEAHAEKLVEREAVRLRRSFEAARADGYTRYVMFLHYPPTNILQTESVFTRMAEEYGAKQVIYAHSHGESRFNDSILGTMNGVHYSLTSGDFLRWKPLKILD